MRTFFFHLSAAAIVAGAIVATPGASRAVESYEVVVKGLGSVTFGRAGAKDATYTISYPNAGPFKGGIQRDEHKYVDYSARMRLLREKKTDKLPPKTAYSNCVVWVRGGESKNPVAYGLLPHFNMSGGLYDHKAVEKFMPKWREQYALARDREYTFDFVPDPDRNRLLVYLDGSVLGALAGTEPVTDVKGVKGLKVVRKGVKPIPVPAGFLSLPALAPSRANALLKSGAKLSVGTGVRDFGGVKIDVWPPELSIDQSKARQTTTHRNLTWDPILARTRWLTGPEYMHWAVPGRNWLYAWVLCADIPMKGKEAILGTQLAKLGPGCTRSNVDVSKKALDESDPAVRKVGTLQYVRDGQPVTTPLFLVRLPLQLGKLGGRGENKLSLDFEFVGDGLWTWCKETSVQIFGATLEEAPYQWKVVNPVRGNIFEQGTDEQKCEIRVTATRDDAAGAVEIEVTDPYFKTLAKSRRPFSIAKKDDKTTVPVNLAKFGVGWYGLFYTFYDANVVKVAEHEAAFTVLAPDDREAGYESPYACWPLKDGYHGSNPNPKEQLDVMRKAGYRKSWFPPVASEEEGKPWKVGKSQMYQEGAYNPGSPTKTYAELVKKLDSSVAKYRAAFEKFPHCNVIQLLHEQGGRDLAPEVAGTRKPVRGEYRGWDFDTPGLKDKERGDWEVFYCTEFAKRIRREFPGKRIMIGNGSSASEKIASLIRRGFDLSLIDQLGIESKGFQTMPELNSNREAPGMLWALRETGRLFGYTNFTLNACNEYVFRPERTVGRDWSKRKIMQVTDFTLRDYLVSLIGGCDIISTGHLEDCNDAYYDTNWGAGGQCKFYPYSYPKRMFTALAVLTRVLDCPKFSRMVRTGENCSYIAEFRRERKTPDYAYALWTPLYDAKAKLSFPAGARVKCVDVWGHDLPFPADGVVTMGSTPTYVISSLPVASARIVDHPDNAPAGHTYEKIADFTLDNVRLAESAPPAPMKDPLAGAGFNRGRFILSSVQDDRVGGEALVATLDTTRIDPRHGHVGGGSDGYGPGTGGGGGGAGGPGAPGRAKGPGAPEGGKGRASDITGERLVYAKGGDGGDWTSRPERKSPHGANGRDGFGDGGSAGSATNGKGGRGGNGVIIVKLDGKVHAFAPGDRVDCIAFKDGEARILVVAGGGGGGATFVNYGGGGGGAGGMDEQTVRVKSGNWFSGIVGRGGDGAVPGKAKAKNGSPSVLMLNGKVISHMLGGGAPGELGGSGGGLVANMYSEAPGGDIPPIRWEAGGVQFRNPPSVAYKPSTRLAVRIYGNSSFSKLALSLEGADGKDYHVGFDTYRNFQCFHGWHTIEASIPEELRKPGVKFKVTGMWFGAARTQIDPFEMAPLDDPLRLKDVLLVTVPEKPSATPSEEAKGAAEVMKKVDDKDL